MCFRQVLDVLDMLLYKSRHLPLQRFVSSSSIVVNRKICRCVFLTTMDEGEKGAVGTSSEIFGE